MSGMCCYCPVQMQVPFLCSFSCSHLADHRRLSQRQQSPKLWLVGCFAYKPEFILDDWRSSKSSFQVALSSSFQSALYWKPQRPLLIQLPQTAKPSVSSKRLPQVSGAHSVNSQCCSFWFLSINILSFCLFKAIILVSSSPTVKSQILQQHFAHR